MTGPGTTPAELSGYLESLDCVHCGLCVEHCPTYRHLGRESANPRGRVYLMRAVMEERIEPTADVLQDLDLCLVCRACESACPSGVQFGDVMAQTRNRLRKRGWLRKRLMGMLLDRGRLDRMATLMRFWQRSGLRVLRFLMPPRLRRMEAYMPTLPAKEQRRPLPTHVPAQGPAKGRVAVLEGCVMPLLFQDVNRDTMRLLQAAGFEVVVPEGQGCCGALHEHDGDLDTAHAQLTKNRQAFAAADPMAIVMNSSGCGAALTAGDMPAPVVDITRFLLDHGHELRFSPFTEPVAYDAPCHLHHAQKETSSVQEMLSRIPDINTVPMELWDHCCGAAGIYNLDHPDLAQRILAEKLDALERSGARVLLTGNPGCLMQWRQGVARRKLNVEVLHPATFLAGQLQS